MKAVLILAPQNGGKTTTINHFDHHHNPFRSLKKQCKAGSRWLRLFHGFNAVSIHIYFVPASPTETGIPLKKRLNDLNNYRPELILVAEQLGSAESERTITFLESEGYDVDLFTITSGATLAHWQRWNNDTFTSVMKQRAEDIGDSFREYVTSRITQ